MKAEDVVLIFCVIGLIIASIGTYYKWQESIENRELNIAYCNEKGYNYYKELDYPRLIGESYGDMVITDDICYNNESSMYGIDELKLEIWKDTRILNNFEVLQ